MQIYLRTAELARALPIVLALLETERFDGDDLRPAARVGVSDDDAVDTRAFRIVYPPGVTGTIAAPLPALRLPVPAELDGIEARLGFRFSPAFRAFAAAPPPAFRRMFPHGRLVAHAKEVATLLAQPAVAPPGPLPDRPAGGAATLLLRSRHTRARSRHRRLLRPHDRRRLAEPRRLADLARNRAGGAVNEAVPIPAPTERREGTFKDVLRYFLRLGTFGFGGPIALVGYMQRDLVEERALDHRRRTTSRASRWRSSRPVRSPRSSRSTSAGPSGGVARRDARRARLRPAVVRDGARALGALRPLRRPGLDAGRVLRHRRRGHRDHRAQRAQAHEADARAGPAAVGALRGRARSSTAWTESEIVWVFLGSGVRGRCWSRGAAADAAAPLVRSAARGRWLVAGRRGHRRRRRWPLLWQHRAGTSPRRAPSCSAAASPSCRSCTAAWSTSFHWLTERQFLDAVAVAMITPGPGRHHGRVHRLPGRGPARRDGRRARRRSCRATCSSSSRRRTSGASPTTRSVQAFVDGVTAAATGAIAGAAFVLGRRAIDRRHRRSLIAVGDAGCCFTRFKKLPEPLVILAAGVLGLALRRT